MSKCIGFNYSNCDGNIRDQHNLDTLKVDDSELKICNIGSSGGSTTGSRCFRSCCGYRDNNNRSTTSSGADGGYIDGLLWLHGSTGVRHVVAHMVQRMQMKSMVDTDG